MNEYVIIITLIYSTIIEYYSSLISFANVSQMQAVKGRWFTDLNIFIKRYVKGIYLTLNVESALKFKLFEVYLTLFILSDRKAEYS